MPTTRLDAVLLERLGGGPGEADERGLDRRRSWVRRRQPADGVCVGEGVVDDRGIGV